MYRQDVIALLGCIGIIALIIGAVVGLVWLFVHIQTEAVYHELCEPIGLTFHQCFWISIEQLALMHNATATIPL